MTCKMLKLQSTTKLPMLLSFNREAIFRQSRGVDFDRHSCRILEGSGKTYDSSQKRIF